MFNKIKYWLRAAADVVMPRECAVCGGVLEAHERHMCQRCLMQLPRTHIEAINFNAMEQLFAGKLPVERAAALFYYEKGSPYAKVIHDMKYRNMARLGIAMGTLAVQQMRASGIFDGIDAVVPVPLHSDKMARRGYNQAEMIARGIARELDIEVVSAVEATRPHSTQTSKGAYERWLNTQGTVAAAPCATSLAGRHVLLVDDVITTGSTLLSCGLALKEIPGMKISIFTLAMAQLS